MVIGTTSCTILGGIEALPKDGFAVAGTKTCHELIPSHACNSNEGVAHRVKHKGVVDLTARCSMDKGPSHTDVTSSNWVLGGGGPDDVPTDLKAPNSGSIPLHFEKNRLGTKRTGCGLHCARKNWTLGMNHGARYKEHNNITIGESPENSAHLEPKGHYVNTHRVIPESDMILPIAHLWNDGTPPYAPIFEELKGCAKDITFKPFEGDTLPSSDTLVTRLPKFTE